jgi:transposase-like protein
MGKSGPKPQFLDIACPNKQCGQFGIAGKGKVMVCGTYQINSGKIRKYICHTCGTSFRDRTNTAFYDLRKRDEKVSQAPKMAMRGMSCMGITEILKTKPSTFSSWISNAAKHSQSLRDQIS